MRTLLQLRDTDQLMHFVRSEAKAAHEGRQIVARLRSLLPLRLKEIKKRWRGSRSAGAAERFALVDKTYLGHVNELLQIKGDAHHSFVQYETHRMLLLARQSLRRAPPWMVQGLRSPQKIPLKK